MRKKALLALHPFLLASYPVLYLYAGNIEQLKFTDIYDALLVSLLATLALLVILSLIFRDIVKGAFLTSTVVILFFSYGHVHEALQVFASVRYFPFDQHMYLLALWADLQTVALFVVWKRGDILSTVNKYLNVVGALLLVTSLVGIVVYRAGNPSTIDPDLLDADAGPQGSSRNQLPDIYYIILDSYSRADVFRDRYGYDNSEFLDALTDRGFYVATDSRANHPFTFLSLASSLNMQYMDFLAEEVGRDAKDRAIPYHMIENHQLWRILDGMGYRLVFVSSGWGPTERNDLADVSFDGHEYGQRVPLSGSRALRLSEFNIVLGRSTALKPIVPAVRRDHVRARTLYNLEKLREVSEMDDPTFAFVHFLIPHAPFVFSRDDGPIAPGGTPVDGKIVEAEAYVANAEYRAEYIDQVMFVNRATSALVDDILAQSDVPPIIVIQADHGNWPFVPAPPTWGPEEFGEVIMPIFNAYYLPEGGDSQLYPSISPVNSFRVILDYYFHTDLGLLEDESYYSDADTPYDFTEITD